MTTSTLKGWARDHPGKAIAFSVAIVVNYAVWLPRVDTSPFWGQQATVLGTFIGLALSVWMLCTIRSDQRKHQNRSKIAAKLMALGLIASMATQQAHAFDPRLLRPPQPTSPVHQQSAGAAVGLIIIGGGGVFIWWLTKKCQQYFGPNSHTNAINRRLDEFGYIEDYISPGGTCPGLAGYNETSLDTRQANYQVTLYLDHNGTASLSGGGIVPTNRLGSGAEFAKSLMDYTGIQGLGGMRGDPHFSRGNEPIEYGESPIYRDWDGTLVILDTNYWSYPDDVVTVERSASPEGPWEPVIAARIPRGTTVELHDSSEGGIQFYRCRAAVQ